MAQKRQPKGALQSKGGQYAPSSPPDEQTTQPLLLDKDSNEKQSVRIGYKKQRLYIKKVNNKWTQEPSDRLLDYPIAQQMAKTGKMFLSDEYEVLDYMGKVTADMLNDGDIEAGMSLGVVKAAVLGSGQMMGLKEGWSDRRVYTHPEEDLMVMYLPHRDREQVQGSINIKYSLLYLMARARTCEYLLNLINTNPQKYRSEGDKHRPTLAQIRKACWTDDILAHTLWFLDDNDPDKIYMGEDEGLLDRYLDTTLGDGYLLSPPERCQYGSADGATWVALAILSNKRIDSNHQTQAFNYLSHCSPHAFNNFKRIRRDLKAILHPHAKTYINHQYRYDLETREWDIPRVERAIASLDAISPTHQN